jgi:Fe(II)/alpha-ketoglutarate-dependent arginine beta-hydroxylase
MAGRAFPPEIAVYDLSETERRGLATELAGWRRYHELDEAQRVAETQLAAVRILPDSIVRFLWDFRSTERFPGIVLTGYPVDDIAIGPTPGHWSAQPDPCSTGREELLFLLVGAMLGEVFSWSTLQQGHLVQNVLPMAGDEQEQSGHGSKALLEWHTEDGFHPYRCDYLGLMCLRNPDNVPTTFASITTVRLPPEAADLLAQPLYLIRPDNEHLRNAGDAADLATSVAAISANPAPTPVIFGSMQDPYLRIDPYFMTPVPGRPDAARALRLLIDELDGGLADLVLLPGDVCFIDNYRAVHGRRRFSARYDGRDRWLKKIIVTRDLRKSRSIRLTAGSRVLA